MNIDLSGKVALITGGSRGIGKSTCLAFARAGADVVFTYRSSKDAAGALVAEIESIGRSGLALRAEASSRKAMEEAFQEALEKFGRLDTAVANAGIWKRAPIDEMTEEQWDETIDANLKSVYLACHLASRVMKPRRSGCLVLVSSTAGQRGEAFYSHYAASKGAVIAMTKALAAELGPSNVRVNCVAPGWVETDMTADVFSDARFREAVETNTPIGRIATPAQVASVILFLVSDLASHLQGEIISVNGGSVLCG